MNHYVYLIDGEPHVGTVQDIAHALEEAAYAGLEVAGAWVPVRSPSTQLYLFEHLEVFDIVTDRTDDFAYHVVRVAGSPEDGRYKIDLRA